MRVSAIIVTRGDVDLGGILDSIPDEWQIIVWNNGIKRVVLYTPPWGEQALLPGKDLSVYGRYAAIEYATGDLIYVQDDDCIVEDPAEIVRNLWRVQDGQLRLDSDVVVCNMPQEFRHGFYVDHALVGFGAAFHRDAPQRAFKNYLSHIPCENMHFCRTCDVIFTGLTPRVLVDVPKTDLPWANDDDRMWKQPTHQAERAGMLDLMKGVRDA